MATNDFDSDAMLAFFAQLGKEIDSLKTKISGLNDAGGGAFNKASEGAEKLGQTIKKHHREAVVPMTSSIKDLATSLAGPVGLAYSIYKVAQSLETFAVGQLRMQNFARDTGFTVKSIKEVQEAARHMGYTVEEASGFLAQFGKTVNDLKVHGQSAAAAISLSQLPRGGIAFSRELEKMAKDGKSYEEILTRVSQEIKKQEARGPEGQRAAIAISEKIGLPLGFLEQYEEMRKKVKPIHVFTDAERAEQQRLNDAWIDMERRFYDDWEKVQQRGVKILVTAEKLARAAQQPDVWDKIKRGADKARAAGARAGKSFDEDLRDPATGLPLPEGDPLDPSQMSPKINWGKRRSSADDDGDGDVLPKGARPTSFDPKEVFETEKDSNKLLQDIRDTLFHMDNPEGGVAGGAGGGGGGGGGLGGGGGGSGSGGGGGGGGRHRGGGGGGDDGGPGADGGTGPQSGNLATQRAAFKKEIEANPKLKDFVIDAAKHEGGVQSNLEQIFNYAAMRHMTINQALHSGQYGPVTGRNRDPHMGNISAKLRAQGAAALEKVYGGSNITDYATDQGMVGDPNFAKYMAHRDYYNMHKVQGAWFSAHGERGRKWAERQRAADVEAAKADEQRDRIDRSAVNLRQHLGTANIDVNFGNVPAGTKTDATMDSGVFKTLRMSRSGQAALAGSGTAPQNNWTLSE